MPAPAAAAKTRSQAADGRDIGAPGTAGGDS